jgi:actin-related protein
LRRDLLENIVISGGSTMFPGIADRVKNDIDTKLGVNCNVTAAPERKYAAWVGGSIFGSTPVFDQFQIKKVDWDTQHDAVFRQKAFL